MRRFLNIWYLAVLGPLALFLGLEGRQAWDRTTQVEQDRKRSLGEKTPETVLVFESAPDAAHPQHRLLLRERYDLQARNEFADAALARLFARQQQPTTFFWLVLINAGEEFWDFFDPLRFSSREAHVTARLQDGSTRGNLALTPADLDDPKGMVARQFIGDFSVPAMTRKRALLAFDGAFRLADVVEFTIETPQGARTLTARNYGRAALEDLLNGQSPRE